MSTYAADVDLMTVPDKDYCDILADWERGDTIEFRIRRNSLDATSDIIEHAKVGQLQISDADLEKLTTIARTGRWTTPNTRTFKATLAKHFCATTFVLVVCTQFEWLKINRVRPQLDINSVLKEDGVTNVRFRFKSGNEAAQKSLHQLHQIGAVVIADPALDIASELAPGLPCPETTSRYSGSMTSHLAGNPSAMAMFMQQVVRHLELLRS